MEEMKTIDNKNVQKEESQNQKEELKKQTKKVKDMSPSEQANYYKTLLQKSKKLNIYYDEENKKLKEKLSQYEGENGKIAEILLIFKHENERFYLFKNEEKKYFINENLLAKSFIEEINNNKKIRTYDYLNDIKSKDDYLTQIINQYEDKLKRMTKENEENENKVKDLKSKTGDLTKQFQEDKQKFEIIIQNFIQNSNDIFINLKNIFDVDLSDEEVNKEIYNKIKNSINNLNINNDKNNQDEKILIWCNELILFMKNILYSYLDTAFQIIKFEVENQSQKSKYQTTIDQLILSQQEEKNQMFKTIEQNKINLKSLSQKITMLEQEKYNISKQKDLTIEMLNKQINKGVNLNYLKNIMISFLTTNDESIQEGLMPVIFTSLQFNESEINQVKKNKDNNKSKSILSYFSGK